MMVAFTVRIARTALDTGDQATKRLKTIHRKRGKDELHLAWVGGQN